ncbi:hypothetical protein FB451DRAFT_1460888 [Mycena latifolia]|nr:hypothetical protein FB451DRAFT_1460888 [Mycena latifolia]
MSLLIQGVPVSSLAFANSSRTSLSSSLASRLPSPRNSAYLFTVSAGGHGPFSFTLLCDVVVPPLVTTDIVLGLDWAACVRDSMLYSGLRLPSSFNSFSFFWSHFNPSPSLLTGPFPRQQPCVHAPACSLLLAYGSSGVNLFAAPYYRSEITSSAVSSPFPPLFSSQPSNFSSASHYRPPAGANSPASSRRDPLSSDSQRDAAVYRRTPSAVASETDPTSDPSTLLQIHILRQVCPILKLSSLRRLLDLHDVTYVESDRVKQLRKRLKGFLTRLKTGKRPQSTKKTRSRESATLRAEWPQLVPESLKRKLLDHFGLRISADKTGSFTCGSCSELCPLGEKTFIRMDGFDWNLLKRPDRLPLPDDDDEDAGSDSCTTHASQSDSESDEPMTFIENVPMPDVAAPLEDETGSDDNHDGRPTPPPPWLSPDCPEPPMPNEVNTPYSDLLLDRSCIESDPETFDPVLVCCKLCRSALKGNRVPPKAVANYNYIGPVPVELAELSVIEEAMVALCRAKCCIIQRETMTPIYPLHSAVSVGTLLFILSGLLQLRNLCLHRSTTLSRLYV